jgi:hypothetical protein
MHRSALIRHGVAIAARGAVPACDVLSAADVWEAFNGALGLPAVSWKDRVNEGGKEMEGWDRRVMRPFAPSLQETTSILLEPSS